jgi:predicted MPP superfamily phosphohydrolase
MNKAGIVSTLPPRKSWIDWLFDAVCIASVAGIYPRFIEPRLLLTSRQRLFFPTLPPSLSGMKVLLFSDLHINATSSPRFLNRIQHTIARLNPDLILFSGDLLTYSKLPRPDLAATFFDALSAPFGVFACLGNHDYQEYSTLDASGEPVAGDPNGNPLLQGIKRLLKSPRSPRQHPLISPLPLNTDLLRFYADHNVTVLNNETVHIGRGIHRINLTGLGDLTSGHLLPSNAYKGYVISQPGIVLAHNPDTYSHLSYFPGDLFLFGHTHGGQVNLPFLWERITPLLDTSLKSGLYHRDGRMIFVTRGVGATFPFRLFAPPQLVIFELFRGGKIRSEALAPSFVETTSATPSFAASRAVRTEEPLP